LGPALLFDLVCARAALIWFTMPIRYFGFISGRDIRLVIFAPTKTYQKHLRHLIQTVHCHYNFYKLGGAFSIAKQTSYSSPK